MKAFLRVFFSVWMGAGLFSCMTPKRFSGLVAERNNLLQQVARLEDKVAELENLCFFLEQEVRQLNGEEAPVVPEKRAEMPPAKAPERSAQVGKVSNKNY